MIEPRFSVAETLTSGDKMYRVECRLTYRKATWFLKLINQGPDEFTNTPDASKPLTRVIIGGDGQRKSSDSMLSEDGHPLDAGDPVVLLRLDDDGNTTDGFRFVDELDFTTLPGFGG